MGRGNHKTHFPSSSSFSCWSSKIAFLSSSLLLRCLYFSLPVVSRKFRVCCAELQLLSIDFDWSWDARCLVDSRSSNPFEIWGSLKTFSAKRILGCWVMNLCLIWSKRKKVSFFRFLFSFNWCVKLYAFLKFGGVEWCELCSDHKDWIFFFSRFGVIVRWIFWFWDLIEFDFLFSLLSENWSAWISDSGVEKKSWDFYHENKILWNPDKCWAGDLSYVETVKIGFFFFPLLFLGWLLGEFSDFGIWKIFLFPFFRK